jgi:outer membrane protein assembly factor BamA
LNPLLHCLWALLVLSLGLGCSTSFAQLVSDSTEFEFLNEGQQYKIEEISFVGHKRTRTSIVSREIDLKPGQIWRGDSLKLQLQLDKNKLFNTLLFVTVESRIQVDSLQGIKVTFLLKERWYTFPVPILEFADRNINEWWSDRNRDLRRIDYGIRFVQYNFTGRNDELRLVAQGGFTQKYEAYYRLPYLDRKQKNGLAAVASYSTNKNVAYATGDNKLLFTGNLDEVIRSRFYSGLQFTHRQKYYAFHRVELRYHQNWIDDTLAVLNANYLGDGRQKQQYLALAVSFVSDRRDIAPYPLQGYYTQVKVEGLGLGMSSEVSLYSLAAEYSLYKPINEHWFWAGKLEGKASTPYRQAYLLQRGLGYGQDFVRGFERQVVDGQQFIFKRQSLRYRMLNKTIKWRENMPIEQFRTMPVAMFLKFFTDAGYVWDMMRQPGNTPLADTILLSAGVGLDLVTYYDMVFRLEYSVNSLGRTGIYFHFSSDI